ncbi:GmrSD restriction endonuclease domain-containing protein [Scardovia wiggsiae]|uniref:GmrSD restriction endonuclease domain-containing protein n=2 Tax=Scardovia wiggsiae TaxID=230143 RepID=UPI00374FD6ED
MDARKGNIYEILNGNRQFLTPVYQRYYGWDIEQCTRLWNDIVEMQKKGRAGHFVGSIVNIAEQAMPTGIQKFMIIDGQQRMTTLSLLLLALRDYAIKDPNDATINARRIDSMLLKNEYESGDERYKLLLTETDRDILIRLVEKMPIPVDTRSKLLDNYKFFAGKIADKELQPAEVYESIGKLQIVNITLDRSIDDAQAIFESLNSTGKELSESDLIRNYVLMGLEPTEQTYVYEHFWRPMELLFVYGVQDSVMDKFFRDYLTMKIARIPKKDRVYEEFKLYHLNCEFSTIRELCQDLLTYAKYYTDMVFKRSSNPAFKSLYEDINDLRMAVSYPFLLKVHNDYADGVISEDDLKLIIRLCISYVFRRSICNIPTNSLDKTFATLRNEVKPDDYVNSIKAFFVMRDDYKEFPNDEKFAAAFVQRDIYSMRTRNFILSQLENYGNKAPIVIENYTIEHIMPQNSSLSPEWQQMLGANWREVQKTYLHTIGNLTLTAYNSEMSDHPFKVKMDMEGGFKESALRLNAYVVKLTEWNEQRIKERAALLADKAKQIWPFPDITAAELAPYQTVEKSAERYSIESYDTNVFTKTLFEALDRRIQNLSPDVKREFKKLYVAYKLDTNFVDIVFQKQRLRISLNMKFSEVIDPNGICHDITGLGRWGNGDVELYMEHASDVDQIMEVVEQAYRLQADE